MDITINMDTKNMTYEKALARVQVLVEELENGQMNLDELAVKLSEAKTLLEFCKNRLKETENEVNNLLADGKK